MLDLQVLAGASTHSLECICRSLTQPTPLCHCSLSSAQHPVCRVALGRINTHRHTRCAYCSAPALQALVGASTHPLECRYQQVQTWLAVVTSDNTPPPHASLHALADASTHP
jgi:hypothetical protein